jgi:hypothetical protein
MEQKKTKYNEAFFIVSNNAEPGESDITEVKICQIRKAIKRYNSLCSSNKNFLSRAIFKVKSKITPTTPIEDSATLNWDVMKLNPRKI